MAALAPYPTPPASCAQDLARRCCGRTLRQPGSGRWVQVARHAGTAASYAYLLQQFGAVGSQALASPGAAQSE